MIRKWSSLRVMFIVNHIGEWSKRNNLMLNWSKSEEIVFSERKSQTGITSATARNSPCQIFEGVERNSMLWMSSLIVQFQTFLWCLSFLSGLSRDNSASIYSPMIYCHLFNLVFVHTTQQKLLFSAFCLTSWKQWIKEMWLLLPSLTYMLLSTL